MAESEPVFHVECIACRTDHLKHNECCLCHPKEDCFLPQIGKFEKYSKEIREHQKREREVKYPELYDQDAKETDEIRKI